MQKTLKLFILGPKPPTGIKIFNSKASELVVQWRDEDNSLIDPVTGYSVVYGIDGKNENRNINVDRSSRFQHQETTTIRNLQTNTRYYFRLKSLTNNVSIQSDESTKVYRTTSE